MPSMPVASTPRTPVPAGVLLIGSEAATGPLVPILKQNYRLVSSSSVARARTFLTRAAIDLLVTDLKLPNGAALDLCRAAKALPAPPAVLMTTDEVERVPYALEAGCDAILLKPFAPNLLVARMGRLLRERREVNRSWPAIHCPYCDEPGAISFEFASYRRAWYACARCKKVWCGKRQEASR